MSQTESISTEEIKTLQLVQQPKASVNSPKRIMIALVVLIIPLLLFSVIQYAKYGFGLFLGWDTSTYVWWAEEVYTYGALALVLQGFPNLYILILAALGALLGSASLAERVLPFIIAAPLGYAYYRLTFEVTSNRRLGYVAAFLGGLSVNTLRLFSDLNRNLFSFGIIMVVGVLMSTQIGSGIFSWKLQKKRAFLVWLPLLVLAAYTQIETYAVFMVTMLILFLSLHNRRNTVLGLLFVVSPVLASLPLTWSFLLNYQSGLGLLGLPPPTPSFALDNSALFLGGLALPWTVLGLASLVRKARHGNSSASFLLLWLVSLLLLSPLSIVLGLPIIRLLFVVPVPALAAAGVWPSIEYGRKLWRTLSEKLPLGLRTRSPSRPLMPSILIGLLVISTFLTSVATADSFLRPYVTGADVNRLMEAAQLVRELGYKQPILVMYGGRAADLNSIYRAYFSIQIPNSLAYYGKLQYLFTLPNPAQVYQFQFDPSYEQASTLKYRAEILANLGNSSNVTAHAIVIAGGTTYDRPLSELFISKFEVMPGIYIIPPGQLQPEQIDSWRLFAYSDWTSTTTTMTANASWARSPNSNVLDWVAKGPGARFEANYTISLADSWPSMQLSLHYFDWPQSYLFPDSSSAVLAPLEIYLDGNFIVSHDYTGQGPSFINYTMPTSIGPGLHKITILSGTSGLASAVALDYLQVCTIPCQYG